MRPGTPAQEVDISLDLVTKLLDSQQPHLASLPLRRFSSGWDNEMFRLGADYLVRLPRRAIAAELVRHEQRVLPLLQPHLSLPIPAPVATGHPEFSYPWHWSVLPWFKGSPVAKMPVDANDLAGFLAELHRIPTDLTAAPLNEFRGVPLIERAESLAPRMQRLQELEIHLMSSELKALWEQGLAAQTTQHRTWLHGDPHPLNMLQQEGKLCAVIDWGDVTQGDPATDLAALWMATNDPARRSRALQRYCETLDIPKGEREPLLTRARGWAFLFGVVLLDSGLVDNADHEQIGRHTLTQLRADLDL